MISALEFRISSASVGGGTYVVALGGEVDLHTAPQLDDELGRLVALGARRVIIDLSSTTFVDSTVLGVLLRARKRLGGSGGAMVIVSDDRRVLRLFEVTGLDRKFRVEQTLVDAMQNTVAA